MTPSFPTRRSSDLHLPECDVWLVELWGSLRAAGFTEALGFRVEDLAMYAEAMSELFRREIRSLVPRLAKLPADRAAELFRRGLPRSEEHTSELQSLMRISYAVFCLKKKNKK